MISNQSDGEAAVKAKYGERGNDSPAAARPFAGLCTRNAQTQAVRALGRAVLSVLSGDCQSNEGSRPLWLKITFHCQHSSALNGIESPTIISTEYLPMVITPSLLQYALVKTPRSKSASDLAFGKHLDSGGSVLTGDVEAIIGGRMMHNGIQPHRPYARRQR